MGGWAGVGEVAVLGRSRAGRRAQRFTALWKRGRAPEGGGLQCLSCLQEQCPCAELSCRKQCAVAALAPMATKQPLTGVCSLQRACTIWCNTSSTNPNGPVQVRVVFSPAAPHPRVAPPAPHSAHLTQQLHLLPQPLHSCGRADVCVWGVGGCGGGWGQRGRWLLGTGAACPWWLQLCKQAACAQGCLLGWLLRGGATPAHPVSLAVALLRQSHPVLSRSHFL